MFRGALVITDRQFLRLKELRAAGKTQQQVADRLELSRDTVNKYDKESHPPSESKKKRTHLTRQNPFDDVWGEIEDLLKINTGLEIKSIFEDLQRRHPGLFQDGQKRTLERRIKLWRLINGPGKEVIFTQVHHPGDLAASDYTKMDKLKITIQGKPFDHMLYHFVLTYSNWETVTICYSETFESLSEGFQNAVHELGGVPAKHRTDNLGAAVINMGNDKGEMTKRYEELLDHYGLDRSKIQPGKPQENGDVERSNGILKKAVDQRLMLRGSRDFDSVENYEKFLRKLMNELNMGRSDRFKEDQAALKSLPQKRLDACSEFNPTVSRHSTINLKGPIYSVPSQLIGIKVCVKQRAASIEVWYGSTLLEVIPRAIGKRAVINYRHIIGSLVRKPGAFAQYKYHAEMFPTSHFREAYDDLLSHLPKKAASEYLKILHFAATYSETEVDRAIQSILNEGKRISLYAVTEHVTRPTSIDRLDVEVKSVAPSSYDCLIFAEAKHGS